MLEQTNYTELSADYTDSTPWSAPTCRRFARLRPVAAMFPVLVKRRRQAGVDQKRRQVGALQGVESV
jgi:hypothetical protein